MLPHYLVKHKCQQKQAVNDKIQGSVATCLKFGGVVNNQIETGLLLSLSVKKVLKSVNIWQNYKHERGCLMHFLHLLEARWPGVYNLGKPVPAAQQFVCSRLALGWLGS